MYISFLKSSMSNKNDELLEIVKFNNKNVNIMIPTRILDDIYFEILWSRELVPWII